ncbi:MAG: CinA family protein, partial [Synergistes sp.]|nr:CinA family protein [Synergistes sp.]
MTGRLDVLAAAVVKNYLERGRTAALAESCTGGMIASAVTDIAGASEIFLGSAVTYANSAKENILGVSPETLAS